MRATTGFGNRHTRTIAAAAVAIVGGALSPPAHAEVTISPDRAEVVTAGARAVLQRSTARLSILDQTGRTVLAQADRSRVPRPFATVDHELLGGDILPDDAAYGPFIYEVGTARRGLLTGGIWAGNLLWSARSGVFHSARAVESIVAVGDEVRATLTTTERHRRLVVTIGPDPSAPAGVRVRVTPTPSHGVIAVGDAFRSGVDEHFYGFGQARNGLDQRGEAPVMWSGYGSGSGGLKAVATALFPRQGAKYIFPAGKHTTGYPQSLFVSSRPYGFFVDNPDVVRWRMAIDRPDAWQVSAAGQSLDYTVVTGDASAAIAQLTAINGRHILPPEWIQRPTLSRAVSTDTTLVRGGYERAVERDLREIERRQSPLGAYFFEGFALLTPEKVRAIVARLAARDIRSVLYMRAIVARDRIGTEDRRFMQEALDGGYLVRDRRTNQAAVFPSPFGSGQAGLVDFTNPAAVRWWEGRIREILDLGADGFMLDLGEQVLDTMRFADGRTGDKMHNAYLVLMSKVTREIVDRYTAEHPERGPIWFHTRGGASGRPGSAAYEMANFPGDWTPDFSAHGGLGGETLDMLNRAVGGAWGYMTNIAGYIDTYTGRPSKELFIRWSQWAALTPYHNVHNGPFYGTVMPWTYGDSTYQRWLDSARLHDRALPLIRRLWKEANDGGPPPLRPLWLAAPGDPAASREEQAWMLGDDVLVAPVVTRGARTRTINLPTGCWTYAGDNRDYNGGQKVTVPAPLEQLPYFTRCGTTPL